MIVRRCDLLFVDEALLEAHRSFEDSTLGIRERFLSLEIGTGTTIGVLSRPLGNERPLGWVICHSFGMEQMDLHMTEVAIARSLAAAGWPVLRFHCQGYGDSQDIHAEPDPLTHLRDTEDAVRHMKAASGVEQIGLVGARFGGAIAALAADREDLPYLIMISPSVSGRSYTRELLRGQVFTELAESAGEGSTVGDLRQTLASQDEVNIKGLNLTRRVTEEIAKIDLATDLRRFKGKALLVQVSRGSQTHKALAKLDATMKSSGAETTLKVVTDQLAIYFGHQHVRPVKSDVLGDALEGLTGNLTQTILEWVQENTRIETGATR